MFSKCSKVGFSYVPELVRAHRGKEAYISLTSDDGVLSKTAPMDDPRIEWVRNRVYQALDIRELEVFEELLERDDGEVERCLLKYLNDTPEENEASILFYKVIKEEEEEVEVECGKFESSMFLSFLLFLLADSVTGDASSSVNSAVP